MKRRSSNLDTKFFSSDSDKSSSDVSQNNRKNLNSTSSAIGRLGIHTANFFDFAYILINLFLNLRNEKFCITASRLGERLMRLDFLFFVIASPAPCSQGAGRGNPEGTKSPQ